MKEINTNERLDVLTGVHEKIAKRQKGGHGRIDSLNGLSKYFRKRFKKFSI